MSIKETLYRALLYIIKGIPNVHVSRTITYINPDNRLKGKKIIVTGGSSGIGASMAKKFVKEGAQVLIVGRKEELLKNIAENIGCKYVVFDLSDIEEIPSFLDTAEKLIGKFNVLVNNAGVSLHEKSFFDVSPSSFNIQFTTNLESPFFLAQEFIKRIEKDGDILFISSEAGDTVDYRPYGFTKGAINSAVKGLANLFKHKGIRINAISPGITASNMTGIQSDGNLYAGEYGSGRFYLPDEIAEIATFMISDASSCISGQIITCNNAQTVNPRWK